ncbi:head completion, neck hetero-dimeric protein [Synechococcus phage S-B68]|nr:head completion, neck hetero-dimeric protein [Synechococcus phage S-B68]
MSIASPQNREEFKQYIKTKLGAPVLQINVSDEQMDVAINDAFQYFHERQHYDATETVYLSVKVSAPFLDFVKTGEIEGVTQSSTQLRYDEGMVDTLTLVNPGTGYSPDDLTGSKTTGGTGSGLTVNPGTVRTTTGGLTTVSIYEAGGGYTVGDQITISGGDNNAVFEVTTLKTSSPLYGTEQISTQNNYIVLPEDVIGVNRILNKSGASGLAGVPGVAFFNPFLVGGAAGSGQVGGMNYDLTSYYSMQQYLATLQWAIFPPISYSFNRRTHRLFINSNTFNGIGEGDYLVFECDVKPSPDVFPDVWNDMFLKQLACAYVQLAWGRVLTKYQQVQLPGGITMNGDQIYNDAKQEIAEIKERFALDYADYPLDIVG